MDIATELRHHQEQDPIMGSFFKALHEWTLRTIIQFFREDMPEMGYPCFRFAKLDGERRGEYTPKDGACLPDVISMDPEVIRDGLEAAEVIAHELVHLWQNHLGYTLENNLHDESFHNKMADYGIVTEGDAGNARGTIGDVWEDWLKDNEDLKLRYYGLGPLEDKADEDE